MTYTEGEIIAFLREMTKLNPGVRFLYNPHSRWVLADICTPELKAKYKTASDLIYPVHYYVDNVMYNDHVQILIDDNKYTVAEVCIDDISSKETLSEFYDGFRLYQDGKREPIRSKVGDSIRGAAHNAKNGLKYYFGKNSTPTVDSTLVVNSKQPEVQVETKPITNVGRELGEFKRQQAKEKSKMGKLYEINEDSSAFGEYMVEPTEETTTKKEESYLFTPTTSKTVEIEPVKVEPVKKAKKDLTGDKGLFIDSKTDTLPGIVPVKAETITKPVDVKVEPVVKEEVKVESTKKPKYTFGQRVKGFINSYKNYFKYSMDKSVREKDIEEPIEKPAKTRKSLKERLSGTFRKVKNGLKYTFSKNMSISKYSESSESEYSEFNKVEPTVVVPTKAPIRRPARTNGNNNRPAFIKTEEKTNTETPVTKEPVKAEVKPTVKPIVKKELEIVEKTFYLSNLEAYNKLGEFEKMFVDDAKAECLEPGDNEFNMMLNERCVNKAQIMAYYEELKLNKVIKKANGNKVDIVCKYTCLDDSERSFVEDAIADNLEFGDNELNMMANYRAVNKEHVLDFMKSYKEFLLNQKEIVKEFYSLNGKDYKTYSINDLRKEVKQNKTKLTQDELAKQKSNSLKKQEIIEILDRIDNKKAEKELNKGLIL